MAEKQLLNGNWKFYPGDEPGADFMGYDDSAWRTVTLPHDWSVEYPFSRNNASGTGYLPGGTAWYRKHFTLTEDPAGRTVRLFFGGVYKHAKVWINSYYLGFHAYGYTSFGYDITPFVRAGENVISVRVEHNDVADSRWFTGSGIWRDVTLEVTGAACFDPYGIFVRTLHADTREAVLKIDYASAGADRVTFELADAAGNPAASAQTEGAKGTAELTVAEPALWSPDSPVLYTLRCRAFKDGKLTDTAEIPVGIRVFRFDPDHGFFLNGENMKIKGVCVHHDAGALGAAVPKPVWERRLRKLKECGCNAIRTAHNPPDPLLLDACDEMGFLVMDEAFDEWEGCKNKWWQGHNVYPPKHFGYAEDFPQYHRQDLESMILRDRNHPCVILWSIGNEVDYPNDPYVTPLFQTVLGNNDANKPMAERMYDVRKPDASRLTAVARELTDIVHSLDLTRPVISAMSFPELSTRTGFAETLDIFGYNYREKFYEEDRKRFPAFAIIGSENSHDAECWAAVRDREDISGQFLWTGVDFLGECAGWPVRISRAGLLDLTGAEKPLFAWRRAMWTAEPYVRMAVGPNPWDQCFVWNGEPGEMKTIACYSNAEKVTLYLNGREISTLPAGKEAGYRAEWALPYEEGELRAVAEDAEDVLRTPGIAARLELLPDKSVLKADGRDVLQTEIILRDAKGGIAAADDRTLTVQLLGDAEILGMENGKPDDLTPYSERSRSTFRGRMLLYLRAGTVPGKIRLLVSDRNGMEAEAEFVAERV